MRWIEAKLVVVLTIAAVAVGALEISHASYLCRMTGQVSDACCCASSQPKEPSGPEITSPDCCQLLKAQPYAAPEALQQLAQRVAPAALSHPLPPLRVPPQYVQISEPPPALATLHPPWPPRFLSHCAFLI